MRSYVRGRKTRVSARVECNCVCKRAEMQPRKSKHALGAEGPKRIYLSNGWPGGWCANGSLIAVFRSLAGPVDFPGDLDGVFGALGWVPEALRARRPPLAGSSIEY